MATPLAQFAIALILSAAIVRALVAARLGLDRPNERSMHGTATPRTGGLGLLAGGGVAWSLVPPGGLDPLVVLVTALVAVFLIEDLRGLSVPLRLGAQTVVAAAFALWTYADTFLLACLLVPALVWSMNAYNFMDGSDGLAGGMAALGFGAYALAAHAEGARDLAAAAAIVSGASLGFLIWNFHPARIFLGDTGSVTLGFLAAAIGFMGCQRGLWAAWFPLLIFSPFLLDATVTLVRRALHRQVIWRAHTCHYYQRLIRMGWSHRRLALWAFGVMTTAAISALTARSASEQTVGIVLAAWGSAYAAIAIAVDRRWRAFQKQTG